MFDASEEDLARWGVPRDTGGPEIVAWMKEFGDDFFARLLAAPDETEIRASSREFFYAVLKATRANKLVIGDATRRTRLMEFLWPRLLGLHTSAQGRDRR